MGNKFSFFVVFLLTVSSIVFGSSDASQFELEKNLVEKLFQKSADTVASQNQEVRSGVAISPVLSFVSFSQLSLTNRYFTVPYAENLGSVPLFQITTEIPMLEAGSFTLKAQASVGYSYRESLYTVQQSSGAEFKDLVQLHWLPISAGLKITFHAKDFYYLVPTLGIGLGIQGLFQSGRLDGTAQNFWVPFGIVSPAVQIWDLASVKPHWFGGFRIGASVSSSFASDQAVRYVAWDMGARFIL